jgi:hypothetical protein
MLLLLLPGLLAGGALLLQGGTPTSTPDGSLITYAPDEATIEECAGNIPCLRQAYANLVYREGAGAALARLAEAMNSDRDILSQCHQISHWMGAAGLLRAEGDLGSAFVEGNETCGSGYWHGVMQARIGGLLADSESALTESLDTLCASEMIRTSPWIAWQCVHGLGHGLLIARDYEIPAALEGCETLSRPWDVDVCANGIFMENIVPSIPGAERPWIRAGDPEYPCREMPERHQASCYQYSADQLIEISGFGPQTATGCLAFTPNWIDACLDGLGRVVGAASAYRPGEVATLCAGAGPRAFVCVSGAAIDSFQNDTANLPRAGAICGVLDGELVAACWEALGWIVGSTAREGEDPAAPCAIAPDPAARERCATSARAAYASY